MLFKKGRDHHEYILYVDDLRITYAAHQLNIYIYNVEFYIDFSSIDGIAQLSNIITTV